MSNTVTKNPVMLYTEQTPNPETLKFVTNRMLFRGTADFSDIDFAKQWSPIATELFDMPFVKGVYVSQNYVTVTKEFNYSWEDIKFKIKEFVKAYVEDGKPIVSEGYEEAKAELDAQKKEAIDYSEEEAETVTKIQDLLEKYVKPAVEMDGGNIEFKSYHDGIVTVVMQGSCSGCPSSTVTLKSGIEGMLKRMLPDKIKEVVSEMG